VKHRVIVGDARGQLMTLPERSVHTCVTSPPYWGLRDYGHNAQIGLEDSLDAYIEKLLEVFRRVHRVLRDDGTLWLNLGDAYASGGGAGKHGYTDGRANRSERRRSLTPPGCKPKDMLGIPWRVAFALQADGWTLRSDIIWAKPNPMPESVTDRPTKSHEHIFLLTKGPKYFYDADAIRETSTERASGNKTRRTLEDVGRARDDNLASSVPYEPDGTGRNARDVWWMSTQPYPEAHFATYPMDLPVRCVMAGTSDKGVCPECGAPWERVVEKTKESRSRPNALTKRTGEDGTGNVCPNDVAGVSVRHLGWKPSCGCECEPAPATVLDPFMGSGTTGAAAAVLGRSSIGVELNPEYAKLAEERIGKAAKGTAYRNDDVTDAPLFTTAE
jgi:DNA modification methylase